MHGTEDEIIPVASAHTLFARAGEPKELFVVPGAAHAEAYTVAPEAYRARVLAFLERYLG